MKIFYLYNVKIEGGGGKGHYLYIVENVHPVLTSSLR